MILLCYFKRPVKLPWVRSRRRLMHSDKGFPEGRKSQLIPLPIFADNYKMVFAFQKGVIDQAYKSKRNPQGDISRKYGNSQVQRISKLIGNKLDKVVSPSQRILCDFSRDDIKPP